MVKAKVTLNLTEGVQGRRTNSFEIYSLNLPLEKF